MPNLTIRANGAETLFQIEAETVSIGRGPHNDVQVEDGSASKEHCRVEQTASGWVLIDLESHNGTRVNGEYRNRADLDHGDTIRIGKVELRFGLEGRSRGAARAGASTAGRAQSPGASQERVRSEEDEQPLPPRRYAKSDAGQKFLVYGGALLGVVLLTALVGSISSRTNRDERNEEVLKRTEALIRNGQWDEAKLYWQKHADRDGNGYPVGVDRIAELERRRPDIQRAGRESEARLELARMANKIANYHRGGSADPSEIRERMSKFKTDYAGTQQDLDAARAYPTWYAGGTPDRDRDRTDPRRKLREDWEALCVKADGYRKQEHFREARETMERFVRVRESTLDAVDLNWLNGELEKRAGNIDRLAGTYFSSVRRRAADLVKKKRFDQATKLYRDVIANYGIDKYVRLAKQGIREVEAAEAKESRKKD
jgi:hypothetical protein